MNNSYWMIVLASQNAQRAMQECNGCTGDVSMIECIVTVVVVMYIVQLLAVWAAIASDNFDSKWQALWWHVPFLPIVVLLIRKFKEIGE